MDDRDQNEVPAILAGLRPGPAPAGLGRAVLAEARSMAARNARRRRKRWLAAALGIAAGWIALLLALPGRGATEEPLPAAVLLEEVAARRLLLELRLERLLDEARNLPVPTQVVDDLESLAREIEALTADPDPGAAQETGWLGTPPGNGGDPHV